ncbi:MAG: CDF family Co(II)/Ni(II) efflux transporter DmeF [Gemmatimonadota bacterium]
MSGSKDLHPWKHGHTFGQDRKRPGEVRTLIVFGITGTMMIIEIVTGVLFGSMALLADGLHMASHTAALGINAFAYAYARNHAGSVRYSFGTGKFNALGGYTGAVLLAVLALLMAWESLDRLVRPVEIVFDQALVVAALGLVVNALCMFLLRVDDVHHGHENHRPDHSLHYVHHTDPNLRSAYLHVMADALTSVLAIIALTAAKFLGYVWMDPAMGILGAILVARWSIGLVRSTSGILLDREGPARIREEIRRSVEEDGASRVADLHVWSIGPGIYSVILAVVAQEPRTPSEYKARLPAGLGLAHVSVEVHECQPDFKLW